ncbi:MAG: hypothetical protein IJO52_00140 [Clostridia bacterium]|nr:hypothetical protein [Clostridia bacterium]
MKFFHVYNENAFTGLEKNGLINKDTGFKIQHVFSMPEDKKFNKIAAKGGKLHSMIKENKIPFYVDRLAGGVTYHEYNFSKELINEYAALLGEWFLGFQLHESGSNRRDSDWQKILKLMGTKGPYDAARLKELIISPYAKMPDGTLLPALSQDTPEQYAKMRYAETPSEYIEEMKELFTRKMSDVAGHILPCDSYYLASKLQNDIGISSFMPEVGCQIPQMRIEVALARGIAKQSGKTWGVYYECWREVRKDGQAFYSMPCFNSDPSNEWYLTQELHPDDFTSYGKNGGSSRLLQNRIYHYALMAGADYFSEEWGLNCSYSDMTDYTLSDYGTLKKNFINDALNFRGIKAVVPFAVVMPGKYSCIELRDMFEPYEIGDHRSEYMRCPLSNGDKAYYGHIEDVLKLIFSKTESLGNEDHVITNSRFPDVFDIIYEDAPKKALESYKYLIDASQGGDFLKSNPEYAHKTLKSADLESLEHTLRCLIKEVMPCYADGLCWLVSHDVNGKRYFSIFNNSGNRRSLEAGDSIIPGTDKKVKITFKDSCAVKLIKQAAGKAELKKISDSEYCATRPSAGFALMEF